MFILLCFWLQAETRKRRSSSPSKQPPDQVVRPGQGGGADWVMWVMTPLVRLQKAPPLGVPLALVRIPALVPAPPPRVLMAEQRVAPPLQKQLSFDPSLIFVQSAGAVGGWLAGRRGLAVSRGGVALPYLPPFGSSLTGLAVLLRARSSLTKVALRLLGPAPEPTRSQRQPEGPGGPSESSAPCPHLPMPAAGDQQPLKGPRGWRCTAAASHWGPYWSGCVSHLHRRSASSLQVPPSAHTSSRRRRSLSWHYVSWWLSIFLVTPPTSC